MIKVKTIEIVNDDSRSTISNKWAKWRYCYCKKDQLTALNRALAVLMVNIKLGDQNR